MARLLVLTDGSPADPEWKGAVAWNIIHSLCESHHEVLVVTTQNPHEIEWTHSRLTVARPITSWAVANMARLAQTVVAFAPEVIHSFALRPAQQWPVMTVWPYLNTFCHMMPRVRRFATLFDASDLNERHSHYPWHQGADGMTVFNERHRILAARALGRPVEVLPLEIESLTSAHHEIDHHGIDERTLIPAPVSEWKNPQRGLHLLTEFLMRNPRHSVAIVGSWGTCSLAQRKEGWQSLKEVAGRVKMLAPLSCVAFARELQNAHAMWLDPLHPDSWKFIFSSELARQMNKKVFLSAPSSATQALVAGSTANSLSRLYSVGTGPPHCV